MNRHSMRRTSGLRTIIAAAAVLSMAGAADARGVAIDSITPTPTAMCVLGSSCSALNTVGMGEFANLNLFIYAPGVVSIGQALPTTATVAGGLGSLGDNYLAPGFANLFNQSAFAQVTASPTGFDDGSGPVVGTLRIAWTFTDPSNNPAIFDVELTDLSLEPFGTPGRDLSKIGQFGVTFAYGSDAGTFFGASNPFLPTPTGVGWSINGVGSQFSFPSTYDLAQDISFTINTAVPEPAAWALMLIGFGLVGGVIRRRANTAMVA